MRNVIMIGCDLHDKTMLLKIATGRDEPSTRSVKNTQTGQAAMIRDLKAQAAQLISQQGSDTGHILTA